MTNSKESKFDHSMFEAVKFEKGKELIDFAEKKAALFSLWSKGQKYSAHGRVMKTLTSGTSLLFTIARTDEVATFEKALESDGISEVLFSVNLPTDVIFFRAEIRRKDTLGMNFKVVDSVYRAQRRKMMRLPILESEGVLATFTLKGETAARVVRLHDLSEGGVGFIEENVSQQTIFSKGFVIHDFVFSVRERAIRVDIEVLYSFDTTPQKKIKTLRFGAVFRKISVDDREFINSYVIEKSSQFFGRI